MTKITKQDELKLKLIGIIERLKKNPNRAEKRKLKKKFESLKREYSKLQ